MAIADYTGGLSFTDNIWQVRSFFDSGDSVFIEVVDPDVDSTGSNDTVTVQLRSGTELTWENVVLTETGAATDTFHGVFPFDVGGTPVDDEQLQVNYDDSVVVRYDDAKDDYGSPATTTQRAAFVNTVITSLAGTQHWYASGSPYLVTEDITVGSSDTLYVHPGVDVKFLVDAQNRTQLDVNGMLSVAGTSDSLISFTSNSYAPNKGDWEGINLNSNRAHLFDYCRVEYAINGISYTAAIDTNTVIQNSTVRNCSNYGIRMDNASASLKLESSIIDSCNSHGIYFYYSHGGYFMVRNSWINDNSGYGIYCYPRYSDAVIDISGDSISGNGTWGIYLQTQFSENSATGSVKQNWISNNSNGVYINAYESTNGMTPLVDSNTISNNTGSYGIQCDNYALPDITNNSITGHSIGISLGFNEEYWTDSIYTITNNTITSNQEGIHAYNWSRVVAQYNDVYDNTSYDFYNQTANDQDCRYNYWGTDATDSMDAGGNPKNITEIYDYYDNASYGEINYAGWLGSVDANIPPTITSTPSTGVMTGNQYTYQVTATDLNGDPLTFSLPIFPSGMTVDSSSGLVEWIAGSPTDYTVKVAVNDTAGDSTYQQYTLTVYPDTIPPDNDMTLIATAADTGRIALSWNPAAIDSSDADSVGIWWKTGDYPDSAHDPSALGSIIVPSGWDHDTAAGLNSGTLYYFSIMARDSSGNWSDTASSANSSATTFTAGIKTWDNGGGDYNWSTPANWLPDGLPGTSDSVLFKATSTDSCRLDTSVQIGALVLTPSYTGPFYFSTDTLEISRSAEFYTTGGIKTGIGCLKFVGASSKWIYAGTADTLPHLRQDGAGGTVVKQNMFTCKKLTVTNGEFDMSTDSVAINFVEGIIIDGGTLTATNGRVNNNGGLLMSAGTFNASDTMYVEDSWTHTGGGFNHNSGTVIFDNPAAAQIEMGQNFYNLTATVGNLTAINSDLSIDNHLELTSGVFSLSSVRLTVNN
ncbi:right-handed parallel beta-helix repeat-containing protein, partial [Fibrobacterota bacterium]